MKKLIVVLLVLIGFAAQAQMPRAKYVLVVGFDGLGGYAFTEGPASMNIPNLKSLINRGAYTYVAQAVMPTSSSPNWASMVMGAPPKITRIPDNGFSIKRATKGSTCGKKSGEFFPTVFKIAKEQNPKLTTYILHDWDDYQRFIDTTTYTYRKDCDGEVKTTQEAVSVINNGMPNLLFIHLDHIDGAGHGAGHKTPEYYKAVEKGDSLLGLMIQALKDKGIYEETVILVTADHGGKNKGHGGGSLDERNIPWIIAGPGVKANYAIQTPVQTYDTAATLAYLLNLRQPDCWTGKNVAEAFTTK